ncbi:MAG: ParB protein [uncultured bacterium (gcode 4)]|uniref:ParB protein n=1 Tax=uncultured bacterium (gcode 4) TaxID=1234023 RepID=K2G2K3_9BACT|nr:MAG: ParB protein [uncultured bacterium (gcode 4)]
MDLTLSEAIRFSDEWRIGEWFQAFLSWKWWNEKLAKIIWASGTVGKLRLVELSDMKRVMWTVEEDLIWKEDKIVWEKRVSDLIDLIESWWQCPPFLLWHQDWIYTLADGNHRFEALKILWIESYWASVWENEEFNPN